MLSAGQRGLERSVHHPPPSPQMCCPGWGTHGAGLVCPQIHEDRCIPARGVTVVLTCRGLLGATGGNWGWKGNVLYPHDTGRGDTEDTARRSVWGWQL